ncbi:MAG: hypothetical protein ACOX3X_05925 [Eubacteriales bacterium]|jgi:hypothetical protein
MTDRDLELFVFSEGREPNEVDEELYKAFLPDGIIGINGVPYNTVKTSNSKIFGIFNAYMRSYRLSSGCVCADDFHPYFLFVTRKTYFRPTDEIWTFDEIVFPKLVGRMFNRYSHSLYSVFTRCQSFALDISLAGGSLEEAARRSYFVFPKGSANMAKLFRATKGLRMCGVITSDDKIRLVSGNEDVAVLPKAAIPPQPAPAALEIDSYDDFDTGYLTAFSKSVDLATPFKFPFVIPSYGKDYKNRVVFNLGYAGRLSRFNCIIPDENKGRINIAEGLSVCYVPMEADEMGISPLAADRIIFTLSGYNPIQGCLAAKYVPGGISKDMFTGYEIADYRHVEYPRGGVIFLTQSPVNAIYLGRLVKAKPAEIEDTDTQEE